MPAPDFLDTNVLVYAYDTTDAQKQQIARQLVRRALAGEILTSTQVLAEFAATLLHKVVPPLSGPDVETILEALSPITLIIPDAEIVRRAVKANGKYGLHFYDGMIVASAERGGCNRILSEDLNSGQQYFGIVAVNPFKPV